MMGGGGPKSDRGLELWMGKIDGGRGQKTNRDGGIIPITDRVSGYLTHRKGINDRREARGLPIVNRENGCSGSSEISSA